MWGWEKNYALHFFYKKVRNFLKKLIWMEENLSNILQNIKSWFKSALPLVILWWWKPLILHGSRVRMDYIHESKIFNEYSCRVAVVAAVASHTTENLRAIWRNSCLAHVQTIAESWSFLWMRVRVQLPLCSNIASNHTFSVRFALFRK